MWVRALLLWAFAGSCLRGSSCHCGPFHGREVLVIRLLRGCGGVVERSEPYDHGRSEGGCKEVPPHSLYLGVCAWQRSFAPMWLSCLYESQRRREPQVKDCALHYLSV